MAYSELPWRPFLGHQAWSWTTLRRGNVFITFTNVFIFLSRFYVFNVFYFYLNVFTSMVCAFWELEWRERGFTARDGSVRCRKIWSHDALGCGLNNNAHPWAELSCLVFYNCRVFNCRSDVKESRSDQYCMRISRRIVVSGSSRRHAHRYAGDARFRSSLNERVNVKYQLSRMDPRDALTHAYCAAHRGGRSDWRQFITLRSVAVCVELSWQHLRRAICEMTVSCGKETSW